MPQPRDEYHYKLVRIHPHRTWIYLAPTDDEALRFFTKMVGVPLQPCISAGSYRLEKYRTDTSGNANQNDLLKITNVKEGE